MSSRSSVLRCPDGKSRLRCCGSERFKHRVRAFRRAPTEPPSARAVCLRTSGCVRRRMMKSRTVVMKKMMMVVKPRLGRVLLATCAGSFFILILYFQSSARAGEFSSYFIIKHKNLTIRTLKRFSEDSCESNGSCCGPPQRDNTQNRQH